jgi:hypothetical protein
LVTKIWFWASSGSECSAPSSGTSHAIHWLSLATASASCGVASRRDARIRDGSSASQ